MLRVHGFRLTVAVNCISVNILLQQLGVKERLIHHLPDLAREPMRNMRESECWDYHWDSYAEE